MVSPDEAKALRFLSVVWGKQPQEGYGFLPYKVGDPEDDWENRQWRKGNPLNGTVPTALPNGGVDVYFSPCRFSSPARKSVDALPGRWLYADLDEVDPHELELKPTIAWRTSPGRYAALWLLDKHMAPQKLQALNKALSQKLGADDCWDLAHVLRPPGTVSTKYAKPSLVELVAKRKGAYTEAQVRKVTEEDGTGTRQQASEAPFEISPLSAEELLAHYEVPKPLRSAIASPPGAQEDRSEVLQGQYKDLFRLGLSQGEVARVMWTVKRARAKFKTQKRLCDDVERVWLKFEAEEPSAKGDASRDLWVDDDELVHAVTQFIRRYVVLSDDEALIVALWVIHTHCIASFEQTPYLSVTSPEKQCGKTRLLEVLALLVARPWPTTLPSEAVLFRKVNADAPTLLLDEVDAIFNARSAERYEGHRGLLNAGNRRGTTVSRCVGQSSQIAEFRTFCAKCIAGIGHLPDTIADRSVPVRLQRKTNDEQVARFLMDEVKPPSIALRDQMAQWGKDHTGSLRKARPQMPQELSDRMEDGCRCLVAIADALSVGGETRTALVAVLGGERLDDQGRMGLRLLRDLHTIWKEKEHKRGKRVLSIRTHLLINELCSIEEAPWGTYYGRTLDARGLASLLKAYDVHSTKVKVGGKPFQGYRRDDLYEVWKRYLPPTKAPQVPQVPASGKGIYKR